MTGPGARSAAELIAQLQPPAVRGPFWRDGEAVFEAGEKQQVYADGVRAVIGDFAQAIVDRSHARLVDEARALTSVRIAEAARRSAGEQRTQCLAPSSAQTELSGKRKK